MTGDLLRTKLTAPPGRPELVLRPRLFTRLDLGLAGPVTLITAPAGAGKTSLIRSWLATRNKAHLPAAWFSIDPDDNGPIRFWSYLLEAIDSCSPGICDSARLALQTASARNLEPILTILINELSAIDRECVVILDDYHLIDNPDIHAAVEFLIERAPDSLCLIMLSRSDPPLPLARWRARGMLAEIRLRDLRFTSEEATRLFGGGVIGPRTLSDQQIATLTERTEGWAAGLHLASLALRGHHDIDGFVRTFAGNHRFVLTYLIDEVLSRLDTRTQTFLIETSILQQLSGDLCATVTGQEDAGQTLDQLHRDGLFLVPLDETGTWYRYHHLFADVLHHRLMQQNQRGIDELHIQAGRWLEESGMTTFAIDHYARGGAYNDATRLITASGRGRGTAGEAEMVSRYLSRLPEDLIQANAELCLTAAWASLVTGPLASVESWLEAAEATVDPAEPNQQHLLAGEAQAIRAMVASFSGDSQAAIHSAGQALALLPETHNHLRAVVSMSLGQVHRFDGNLQASEQAYTDAVELGLSVGNLYAAIDSLSDLGLVLMRLGRLHDAEAAFRRAERELADREATDLPEAGSLAVIWPDLLRERNQLAEAREMIQRGIYLGQSGAKMDLLITGYRGLGLILSAMGDPEAGLDALATAHKYAELYGLEHTARGIVAREMQIRLSIEDLVPVEQWFQRYRPDSSLPGTVTEWEQLLLAKVHLSRDEHTRAQSILDTLQAAAEETDRTGDLLKVLAVQALVNDASGHRQAAISTLSNALTLAEPEGFVRVFLDEGEPMRELIERIADGNRSVHYAGYLLGQAREFSARTGRKSPVVTLAEPLSERERDVLRLLGAGLSSPEIAREMFVAPSTVRSHLKSIYRKLDVHSRDQAIARARDLDLLSH
jgi:LuxR family transcriptional regulator, maltose regulon positive regulatory protein